MLITSKRKNRENRTYVDRESEFKRKKARIW